MHSTTVNRCINHKKIDNLIKYNQSWVVLIDKYKKGMFDINMGRVNEL